MVKHWLSNMFDPAGSRVYGPPARVCLTAGSNVRTGTSMPISGDLIGSFRHATTWWRRSSKWDFLFRMSGTESNWPCWRARRVILARERSFQCWLFRLSSGRGPYRVLRSERFLAHRFLLFQDLSWRNVIPIQYGWPPGLLHAFQLTPAACSFKLGPWQAGL